MLPDTTPPSRADRSPVADSTGPANTALADWPVGDVSEVEDGLAHRYAWPADSGAPFVRANMIGSLDGGSTVDGRSAGLGNSQDEQLFAILRDLADVILVGSGTVRTEGYGGIRFDDGRRARRQRWGFDPTPPPIAVVTNCGLDPESALFTDTVTPPIVITTETAAQLVPDGATKIITGHERVNLTVTIRALAVAGYRRIHCEGGPALLASLLAADLVDECCLTIAPLLLGSRSTAMVPTELAEPIRWELRAAMVGGSHLFTRYRRAVPR